MFLGGYCKYRHLLDKETFHLETRRGRHYVSCRKCSAERKRKQRYRKHILEYRKKYGTSLCPRGEHRMDFGVLVATPSRWGIKLSCAKCADSLSAEQIEANEIEHMRAVWSGNWLGKVCKNGHGRDYDNTEFAWNETRDIFQIVCLQCKAERKIVKKQESKTQKLQYMLEDLEMLLPTLSTADLATRLGYANLASLRRAVLGAGRMDLVQRLDLKKRGEE